MQDESSSSRASFDQATREVAKRPSSRTPHTPPASPRDETVFSRELESSAPPPSYALDASASELRVGAELGRYVILSKLGEGGMGQVYSAFDEELERRVAIKVLREGFAGDTQGQARMQREAQALARLSHPNVVQVYDVGRLDGRLFLAMEFVKGETLRAWQRRHDPRSRAGRRAILDMYIRAGRGLAAAHARGLVHRDFKPEARRSCNPLRDTKNSPARSRSSAAAPARDLMSLWTLRTGKRRVSTMARSRERARHLVISSSRHLGIPSSGGIPGGIPGPGEFAGRQSAADLSQSAASSFALPLGEVVARSE